MTFKMFRSCLLLPLGMFALSTLVPVSTESGRKDFLLVTVATNQTEGYQRFMRSATVNHVPVKVLGMGQAWKGGNMNYAGGGFKVNLLREELEQHKDDPDKVIMFTDSYDVVVLADPERILDQFERTGARVLFSAEGFCWPDESLAVQYPTITRGKRFLNSGGFIGYAPELYAVVTHAAIADTDDDQLFYTRAYLDEKLRTKLKIKLDHKSDIFQNLNGAAGDVELRFKGHRSYLQNTAYNTVPLVVHGNGRSKVLLNTLGNYLAGAWHPEEGCVACWDNTLSLDGKKPKAYPTVMAAIFVEQATPFLEEFFEKFAAQDYPKSRMHLFVHNAVEYHAKLVENFLSKHGKEYLSVKKISWEDNFPERKARNLALDHFLKKKCDMYFNVDGEAHLDNRHTLRLLVEQNRTVTAPLLVRPYKTWSNFWGALTSDGFYARSTDYMDIINNDRRGLWNVPYVSGCYLVNGSVIRDPSLRPTYDRGTMDPDMAFCSSLREKDIFMHVSNRLDFGHLVDPDTFDTSKTNPEVYQIFENRWDWEQRYIHANYTENFNPNNTAQQPCPDVYWFPILTPRFCKEFIEIMEAFGQWSDGTNHDPRLEGGYENVPTRDIHMKQVGLDPQWMEFLRLYVRPLQELVFLGYIHDPPRSLMNFVVRYRPDEQPSLRPHHDSSTYTINVALNTPKVDYEGGGCRFIRYNCSVTNTRLGWMLMHPGRLTHYHEGLKVTKGTRYIMISFVDP
ncbi:procollagen-lysine,2-oxoglutarate 5-dioxygenase [Schistocerca americana]|uniref:procollagen-lysine,2-oxoglutarate 5-dioxygenase n=1 Tax=Schistocerca americana TaxID=7009 RepID=UPI001F4F78A9|nr:procollagen-lysine,2-oxoglutarate 5-dioxygenase [Schistocerca americana]